MLNNDNQGQGISVLITGHTSGLGLSLLNEYLNNNATVFGLSRSLLELINPQFTEVRIDLSHHSKIPSALEALEIKGCNLDVVFLNAAELGEITALNKLTLAALKRTMDINAWANKIIIDWFLRANIQPRQIVMISSGASINGNYGWGAYALSKSSLNMLAQLYAHEFQRCHISAVTPGLIDTQMQKSLREKDPTEFPSLVRMQKAYKEKQLPDAKITAKKLIAQLDKIARFPSGSYVDLRNI